MNLRYLKYKINVGGTMNAYLFQSMSAKGHTFRLKKNLGNINRGEKVHCFAEDEHYIWLHLPREWFGVRELKLKKSLREYFLELVL